MHALPCASAAILALMTSFDILTNLVNVGYLFGAMMVAASVLIRRYLPRGPEATPASRAAVLVRFWLVVGFSIGGHAEILWLYINLAQFSHNRSSRSYRLPVLLHGELSSCVLLPCNEFLHRWACSSPRGGSTCFSDADLYILWGCSTIHMTVSEVW